MAYFAEIDNTNTVIRVLAVPDDQEQRGQEYLADDLNLGGIWIQTSFNHRIRKQFAGIGCTYNADADVFIAPQPFPSWTLDESHDWQPPIPCPEGMHRWNEETQEWVQQ